MCAVSSPQAHLPTAQEAPAPVGGALALTRAGWALTTVVCLTLFLSALPRRYAELAHIVAASGGSHGSPPTSTSTLFTAGAFTLDLLSPVVFLTLAVFILWRRSDNTSAIRISALLFAFGVSLPGTTAAVLTATPIWRITPGLLEAIGWTALLIFAYLFPDGRWVPRWARFVAPVWMLWTVSFFFFAERIIASRPALIALSFLLWILWLGSGVCAQIYRYYWVATHPERQQTKWVMLGFIAGLVGILAVSAPDILALAQRRPIQHNGAYLAIALVIMTLATLPIPISIAIAILRYSLYEIDRLINLTLVYSALTVALGAIYTTIVGLSQIVVQLVTGSQSEPQLALVVSTLCSAALFQPLRRRIQHAIDRRFYRGRYNAAKAVEAFAASLRTELDLTELSERLLDVSHRTMKPAHVSLWLAQPRASTPRDSQRSDMVSLSESPPTRDGAR